MTNDERSCSTSSLEPRRHYQQVAAARRKKGEAIGEELRNQFQHLLAEPLPDHLLELLNALEQQESET